MSYIYEFPQASPCSCIVIYTRNGNEVSMLSTVRDASVGVGRSLSAGGFDEVQNAFHRAGQMIDGIEETYREMWEELGIGLQQIIPYEDFKKRVEYLWDGLIPKEQHPLVEKAVFRTLEVTQEEMAAILALPPTSEQKGKKLETFTLNDDRDVPVNSQIIGQVLTGFKYPHEVEAARMWFEKMEQKAKAAGPTVGFSW